MSDVTRACPFCGKPFDVMGLTDNTSLFKHDSDCVLGERTGGQVISLHFTDIWEMLNARPLEDALRAELQAANEDADRLCNALLQVKEWGEDLSYSPDYDDAMYEAISAHKARKEART